MSALLIFLIAVGPFLVVGPIAAIAEMQWPGLFRPPMGPRPRPVTRPRPRYRTAVAW